MASDGNAVIELTISQKVLVEANQLYRSFSAFMLLSAEKEMIEADKNTYTTMLDQVTRPDDQHRLKLYFEAGGEQIRLINLKKSLSILQCFMSTVQDNLSIEFTADQLVVSDEEETHHLEYTLNASVLSIISSSLPTILPGDYNIVLKPAPEELFLTIEQLFQEGENIVSFTGRGALKLQTPDDEMLSYLQGNAIYEGQGTLAEQKMLADKAFKAEPRRRLYLDFFKPLNEADYELIKTLSFSTTDVLCSNDSLGLIWALCGSLNRREAFPKSEFNIDFNSLLGSAPLYDDDRIRLHQQYGMAYYCRYHFLNTVYAGGFCTQEDGLSLQVWFIRQSLINDVKAKAMSFLLNHEAKMRDEDFKSIALCFDAVLTRYQQQKMISAFTPTTYTTYDNLSDHEKDQKISGGYQTSVTIPNAIAKVEAHILTH